MTNLNKSPVSAHPAYVQLLAMFDNIGFTITDKTILEDLSRFNNPPTPEGVPETAPYVTKVIPASAENGTGKVTLTLIRPKGSENELLPVAVYLHGGGWAMGSLKFSEKFVKDVVVKARVVVVYVEYSFSPKYKYPVALEEIYSSILWLHENADSIRADSSKLSVIGDSAGGNLSAAVTLLLKRRGHGQVVKNQILIYPVVGFDRHDYDSYKDYGNGDYLLSGEEMDCFVSHYHENKYKTNNGPEDPLFSPLLATDDDLKGLPRSLILTAECDILRDEGEDYARRLVEVGVDVCAVRLIGAMHGFIIGAYDTSIYKNALVMVTGYLKE